MTTYQYEGDELEVFAHARNWKAYIRSLIAEYVTGDVLEVGAGLGSTTVALASGRERSWTCLEPDAQFAGALERRLKTTGASVSPRIVIGTLPDLPGTAAYDAIVYVDVLEHIEHDGLELRRARALLRPAGALIVLSPAHQRLYTRFDARIGHRRRYNRAALERISPPDAVLEVMRYLDSCGMLLSAANRFLIHSSQPTLRQIRIWDRYFVRVSRRLDPILRWRVGKSILAVWRAKRGSDPFLPFPKKWV